MIMTQLKERTRVLHEQIEVRVDLPNCMQSQKHYRQLLEKFFGYYEPVETHLATITADQFDFAARRKTERLSRDLTVLDLAPTDLAALPRCTALPTLNNLAQALGCLYVLEGATLGGQIISRQLRERFGFDEQHGAAFFNGYGAETGTKWKAFGAAVTACATTPELEELIIHAASETFLTLDQWLSRNENIA